MNLSGMVPVNYGAHEAVGRLVLNEQDSGLQGSPIIYRAYQARLTKISS